jgi:hypothetical protein
MISTIDELATDAKSSLEHSLELLRSPSKSITPDFLLDLESQSRVVFQVTALAAKSSDDLDEIAKDWLELHKLYGVVHDLLEALSHEQTNYRIDPEHTKRVLNLLDQLCKRTQRLYDLHA